MDAMWRNVFIYTCVISCVVIVLADLKHAIANIIVGIIPVVNVIAAIYSIKLFIERRKDSNGSCTWGHAFREIPKTHQMGICGGFIHYKCTKCPEQYHEKWTAF